MSKIDFAIYAHRSNLLIIQDFMVTQGIGRIILKEIKFIRIDTD